MKKKVRKEMEIKGGKERSELGTKEGKKEGKKEGQREGSMKQIRKERMKDLLRLSHVQWKIRICTST